MRSADLMTYREGLAWLSGACDSPTSQKGPLISRVNAALTPRACLRVAKLVVEQCVQISEVAARFQCSCPTVKRWADRNRAGEPMEDCSSRAHQSPNNTPKPVTERVVSLRLSLRESATDHTVNQRPRSVQLVYHANL